MSVPQRLVCLVALSVLGVVCSTGFAASPDPAAALRQAVVAGVREAGTATIEVDYAGRPISGRLIDADEQGIRVVLYGTPVRIAWNGLSAQRLYLIARRYADPTSAADGAALERFRKAAGLAQGGAAGLAARRSRPRQRQAAGRRHRTRRSAAARARVSSAKSVGIVSNIKVLSDKVKDVASIEAWKDSYIKPGMSDQEKALAIWESVSAHQHQETPPQEYTHASSNVRDPIKVFNVYGYSMCDSASANVEALARHLGLKARGWGINSHSVPEVFFANAWHLLDSSLICYFPKADGQIAGVQEIIAGVKDWYARNPAFQNNDPKLRQFMRGLGWKKGPAVLSRSSAYDKNGWLPAATHGWYSTMQEYDGSRAFIYEYGYTMGYRVNVQLREGEVLTRNWFNKGLHVNMDGNGSTPGTLRRKVGVRSLRYSPKFGDLAPGRIGNGTRVYNVPLKNGAVARGARRYENLAANAADRKAPALHAENPARPGVLELRMPSSYVYLGGRLSGRFVVGEGGAIRVSLARNHGGDWREIFAKTEAGASDETVDLKPLIFRLYNYYLRFEFRGAGTGLDSLRIAHEIQHSQRPLPALSAGTNTITFAAAPAEGTVTIEGRLAEKSRGNQLVALEFKPRLVNIRVKNGFWLRGSAGSVTFPIETPGEMTRLRFGAHFRARDKADGWEYLVSFDEGRTWKPAGRAWGPIAGSCKYVTFADVPQGTRKALVRFAGSQRSVTGIFDLRIDADYIEPRGGFRPVKVTYIWAENGSEKRHVHVAAQPHETYQIRCAQKPLMKSLVVELAP